MLGSCLHWDGSQDDLMVNISLPSWGGKQAGHPSGETAQIPGMGPCWRSALETCLPITPPRAALAGLLPVALWGSLLHPDTLHLLCFPLLAVLQSFLPKICTLAVLGPLQRAGGRWPGCPIQLPCSLALLSPGSLQTGLLR